MKYIKIVLVLVMSLVLITGCGLDEDEDENIVNTPTEEPPKEVPPTKEPSSPAEPTNVEPTKTPSITQKAHYGNWIYLDDSSSAKIDGDFNYSIKTLGDNFIEIEKEGDKKLLIRDGCTDGTVTLQLYNDVKTVQKFNKVKDKMEIHHIPIFKQTEDEKNIKILLKDSFHEDTKYASPNGKVVFQKVYCGKNEYATITVQREKPSFERTYSNDNNESNDTIIHEPFHIPSTNTHIGNIPIPSDETKKNNTYISKVTKTEIKKTEGEDDRYMYESRTYEGTFTYKNLSNTEALGLHYTIFTSDSYIEEIKFTEDKRGTLEANTSINIPFEVSFRTIDKFRHNAKIDFIVRDAYDNIVLIDNIYLDVYQMPIWVNFKSKKENIKGYFISPEREIINMNTQNFRVKLPIRDDSKYYHFLVVGGDDVESETHYTFGIDSNISSFDNISTSDEPNDLEKDAHKLYIGDSKAFFLHKGDRDFFTIDFESSKPSLTPPQLPFN